MTRKTPLPTRCPHEAENSNSRLGYLAWHQDADRRTKAGQRQLYCLTCGLWRWPDGAKQCPAAELAKGLPYEPKEEE